MEVRIFSEKPTHLEFKSQVVGCFLEYRDKFLLLHRQDYVPQGNRWGVPGGKMEKDETPEAAAIRETREETGFDISRSPFSYVGKLYVAQPHLHFIYHMVRCKLLDNPETVKIHFKEHKGFTWVTPQEALKMPRVMDDDDCLKLAYPHLENSTKDLSTLL